MSHIRISTIGDTYQGHDRAKAGGGSGRYGMKGEAEDKRESFAVPSAPRGRSAVTSVSRFLTGDPR